MHEYGLNATARKAAERLRMPRAHTTKNKKD